MIFVPTNENAKCDLTLIFDLDGTLVDSFEQIKSACLATRKILGLEEISESEIRNRIGLPASELFPEVQNELIEHVVFKFRDLLSKAIKEKNELFPGTLDLLDLIKAYGYKCAIATSKPHKLARLVVEHSELKSSIDFYQGIDGFPGKPNPTVIWKCREKLPSRRFVMVGDRPEDIQAGNAAGCFTIGLAQGVFSKRELLSMGADVSFDTINELRENFENLRLELVAF